MAYWSFITYLLLLPLVSLQQRKLQTTVPDIRLPPSITVTAPQSKYFKDGDVIHLRCSSTGYPEPTINWAFNGGALTNKTKSNVLVFEDGAVTISNATMENDGQYKCDAINKWGRATSAKVTLQMANNGPTMPSPPSASTQVKFQGQSAKIPCEGVGVGEFVPSANYYWGYFGQSGLKQNVTTTQRIIEYEGTLYIANLVLEDSGAYQCKGINTITNERVIGYMTDLDVREKTPIEETRPQRLFSSKNPIVGMIHDTIQIVCIFAGFPTPAVSWYRNSVQITSNDHHQISPYGQMLTIINATEQDAGSFECTGHNDKGRLPITTHVTILKPRYFADPSQRPSDMNVTVGETVTVRCQPSGNPPVDKIDWTINGRYLDQAKRRFKRLQKIKMQNDSITIPNVCKSCTDGGTDLMVLRCIYSDSSEIHHIAEGYLNVLERTIITVAPNDTNMKNNQANLECRAKSDPSTSVVYSWWFRGKPLNLSDPTFNLEEHHQILNLNLSLVPRLYDYVGLYICHATNGYSKATASAYVDGPQLPRYLQLLMYKAVVTFILFVCVVVLASISISKIRDLRF